MTVRTRFAPSPTGFLHVGTARTALFAWLHARKHGGRFILRIEDTDKAREVEGAIGHIMESLRWLGIEWDESTDIGGAYGPYIQSARLELYRDYARTLVERGFAYPDPFTEQQVEEFRQQAQEAGKPFLYREHRPETMSEWDGSSALRFRVPELKRYTWTDMIMGELSAGEEALDDFILMKADGFPTYNFAHVVDDITMDITHVTRGQEFVASTPKFLSLYDALGRTPPVFATLPPILGESGTKKLSKRDGAKDVLDYRADGFLPGAMVNFLALLGWHPSDDREILSQDELIEAFDLSRVQRAGARFDDAKLLHINREWMRQLDDDEYARVGELIATKNEAESERIRATIPLIKERAHTFSEARAVLDGELRFLVGEAPQLDRAQLIQKSPDYNADETKKHLEAILGLIQSLPEGVGAPGVQLALMPYADGVTKEQGGRGAALWPLRYALSGQERSPDPFTIVAILGPHEARSRVEKAIGIL